MSNYNNNYYSNSTISNNQYNAITNTGNNSLIEIANQAKSYASNGDYSKAAIYSDYLISNLNNNYGINYKDDISQNFYASTQNALNHYYYKKK